MRTFFILLLITINPSWAGDNSEQRLEEIQTEIQTLSADLKQTKKTKTELYQQLKQQSQAVSNLNKELRQLDQQLTQQAAQLVELKQQQQQQQQQKHAKQLNALNDQLRAAYINAQPNYLKILLNQHEPSNLMRASVYFHYFHQARQQQLTTISATLQILTDSQQQLLAAQQQHKQTYQQRQQQQQTLQQQNEQRIATLKQLELKLSSQGARITALREEEQSLQTLLNKLSKKNLDDLGFAKRKGSLAWPIKGKVVDHYGRSRNLGTLTWQGIMIAAPAGRDVNSSAPGRVVFSGWLRGFGLLLIVDHGNQYMTLYSNNQALLKEVDDTVDTGELIALSGDKGIKQYAGLYFELRHKGSPTNPARWFGK